LVTTFIPSAWADDALIAERKAGLEQYLAKLLDVPQYRQSDAVQEFLALSIPSSPPQFELEDAIPSTLSRKTAEELISAAATFISAAYYPCKSPKEYFFSSLRPAVISAWSADSFAPEKLDYSKFDILFFGKSLGFFRCAY
jgi:chitinase